MGQSLSFDRAADFYDRTRELPQEVVSRGIPAILAAAGSGARILDVGTGTGRLSVPMLAAGARLVGLDLSWKMMSVLRKKRPGAPLVLADASVVPFASAGFDAVLTCHVMHLIGPWREALREFRRVLRNGGVYINARTERTGESGHERLREHWRNWINAHGGSLDRPGARDELEVASELQSMSASIDRVAAARVTGSESVGAIIEAIRGRIHSTTWSIPDGLLADSVEDLQQWARIEYGQDYASHVLEEEGIFVLDVARFSA